MKNIFHNNILGVPLRVGLSVSSPRHAKRVTAGFPLQSLTRIIFLFGILFFSFGNSFSQKKAYPVIYHPAIKDTSGLRKSFFELKKDSVRQTFKATWINDTIILGQIVNHKGHLTSDYASALIEKHPNKIATFFSFLGKKYPIRKFIAEDKKSKIFVQMNIASDNSFAIIKNWNNEPNSSLLLGKKMRLKK